MNGLGLALSTVNGAVKLSWFDLYLVGAVEQGEDVSLLHSNFSGTLLLVVIQGQDQLFPSLIISWCHLLL